MDNTNKDYVINLRVSRATYEKIKHKARENSESVSTLIRKAISDSVEIIGDLSDELFQKREKFKDIIGYHRFKTAQELECAQCRSKIPAGETATVGETEKTRKYFFCKICRP
ncbi:MAG: hypothetical protein A2915_00810 [Candidatus Yanofskybacteria bacterium RIFCSPLOWO2_01_FULL_41_34]|uniref:Uncharacterized protein n=1 Tax=Candidatus Yanofskybacteria bacterium RIFCSPHIGHO2_01_FULL_41_26 TaxID=1802661 RepID=A0A1F8EEE5_9BACT|nr:MAG: hypothetical protein A2649_02845 [Candidatus Yanofskybacteria bacterium RIFCSPHIGHO2_01_FULL_41_26]OGN22435.1 MAG: hypothetical protein A2915_00810 [Candidatus Yanofskybacteria bacterium RIFCSPLOWO2_01_FULL_41_34]